MAVTLEWIRDNYDADKNRLIEAAENWQAMKDHAAGKITLEQQEAVKAVYLSKVRLPAYGTTPTPSGRSPPCGRYGDVDGDGKVTDADADMVKNYISNPSRYPLTSSQRDRADVTGIGKISLADAIAIQKYVDGGINTFDVCSAPAPTPSPTPTPTQTDLVWVRDNYDKSKDRRINASENWQSMKDQGAGLITSEQQDAVADAYKNQTLLPAYGTAPTPTPTPSPGMETRTMSLEVGKTYPIEVQFAGYHTLKASVRVSSSGVACVSGPCGGSDLPRVATSGFTVTTHLKPVTGTGVPVSYNDWISGLGGIFKVGLGDIFKLKDAFVGTPTDLGFSPTLEQIMSCKDSYVQIF